MKLLSLIFLVPVVLFNCASPQNNSDPTEPKCVWTSDIDFFPLVVGNTWKYRFIENIDTCKDKLRPSTDGRDDIRRAGVHQYTILTKLTDTRFTCKLEAKDSIFYLDTNGIATFKKDSVLSDTFEIYFEGNSVMAQDYMFTNTTFSAYAKPLTTALPFGDTVLCVAHKNIGGSTESSISHYINSVGLSYHYLAAGSKRLGIPIDDSNHTLWLLSFNGIPYDGLKIANELEKIDTTP